MLSDLVDTKGLLTTLIILESDYEVKKQKKLGEQLSEMVSQATKITATETHQQEVFQTVPMAEFSWHMMYNSDVKTYLGHIEKFRPHNISVLRSYLSLKRPLEILGAYQVNTIYETTFEQFQFATSLLLQNQKHNLPVEKRPTDLVIARDCYGGYVMILIDLPSRTGAPTAMSLQTILCLPLLGRFCIQLLQPNKW